MFPTLNLQSTSIVSTGSSADFRKQQAQIYGKRKHKDLSDHQKRINEAAENIALSLLSSCQKLLEKARESVESSGYVYKKGKCRSKRLCSPSEELAGAKHVRTTASIRSGSYTCTRRTD